MLCGTWAKRILLKYLISQPMPRHILEYAYGAIKKWNKLWQFPIKLKLKAMFFSEIMHLQLDITWQQMPNTRALRYFYLLILEK